MPKPASTARPATSDDRLAGHAQRCGFTVDFAHRVRWLSADQTRPPFPSGPIHLRWLGGGEAVARFVWPEEVRAYPSSCVQLTLASMTAMMVRPARSAMTEPNPVSRGEGRAVDHTVAPSTRMRPTPLRLARERI